MSDPRIQMGGAIIGGFFGWFYAYHTEFLISNGLFFSACAGLIIGGAMWALVRWLG